LKNDKIYSYIILYSYGIQFEPVAKEEFELLYKFNVIAAGLFVDPTLPYLAASPDGLIGDHSII